MRPTDKSITAHLCFVWRLLGEWITIVVQNLSLRLL